MDFGSFLIVNLMRISKDDWILDMCTAPGSKLLFILDLMKEQKIDHF